MTKTMTVHTENGGKHQMSRWRMAAWAAALLFLLANFVAMQITDEVSWTASDFVFAGVLLFVPLGIYELVARKSGSPAYRTGAGMALAATLFVFWISGAVGITDSDADILYFVAVAVGVVGAFVARFQARGMVWAMSATAFALALAGIAALATGMVPAHNSAFKIMGITALFIVFFGGSALLFREAARAQAQRDAAAGPR